MKTIANRIIRVLRPEFNLSAFCWSLVATLSIFFCLTHLFVIASFSAGWSVSPGAAPTAFLISIVAGCLLAGRNGLRHSSMVSMIASCAVVVVSFILANAFYDMSWDGLWYHQTAVYQMSDGWNPLRDPMHNFVPHLQTWLRYYAKGPWYIALALFTTTGNIEMSKAAPWIALAASYFAVFAASLDFGIRRRKAALIAALVSLNPVVICQLASYLVDGLLISFLACFVAALFRWFRKPNLITLIVISSSAIICINAKLTGLVYLCFFVAAGGIYLLIRRRDLFWKYAGMQGAVIVLGMALFGFNPYITNMIHRGHPFYPILGTAAYPSMSERGQDPIERDETPHNMVGRSRFIRFGYAIFGRPGSQPFFQGENASLMWPFDVGWKDFHIFYFHEVRISGFGPFFSGAFIFSLFLFTFVLARPTIPRIIIFIFVGATVFSLLISNHSWWARYAPQLWWLPVFAVIAGMISNVRFVRRSAYVLAAVLLVNAALITVAHFQWEIEATRTTNEQMTLLRQQGVVEADFQYFGEPFGRRLHSAGVAFRPVPNLPCTTPMELMSVAPGYPGAVRVCIQKK